LGIASNQDVCLMAQLNHFHCRFLIIFLCHNCVYRSGGQVIDLLQYSRGDRYLSHRSRHTQVPVPATSSRCRFYIILAISKTVICCKNKYLF
jgi:hypothetical protein